MSGNNGVNITASIIDGATRGYIQGTSRANARNAAEWKRAYNGLVDEYNVLMGEFNDLNKRFHRMGELYKQVQKTRDEYGEMIDDLNKTVQELNTVVLSGNADRTKAYDYIIELSNALRLADPNNLTLTNPNSILSNVNFYSAKRMQEAANLINAEVASGSISQFSKHNDAGRFKTESDKRLERGGKYKEAADKGILEVDKNITPTF